MDVEHFIDRCERELDGCSALPLLGEGYPLPLFFDRAYATEQFDCGVAPEDKMEGWIPFASFYADSSRDQLSDSWAFLLVSPDGAIHFWTDEGHERICDSTTTFLERLTR